MNEVTTFASKINVTPRWEVEEGFLIVYYTNIKGNKPQIDSKDIKAALGYLEDRGPQHVSFSY